MLPRGQASPVPTYTTLWSESATAMAPIEEIFCSSNMGFQDAPASMLFHTPPATPPKYQVEGSPGTPLTATTRPPRNGPIWRHFMPSSSAGFTSANAAVHNMGSKKSATSLAADRVNRCLIFSYSDATCAWRIVQQNVRSI